MKNNYVVLVSVKLYQNNNSSCYTPIHWTFICEAKNKLEAINNVLKHYQDSTYGYDKFAKVELEEIISVNKFNEE